MIQFPPELRKCLDQDQDLATIVTNNLLPFASILEDKLHFFPDYTDHSITHNEEVLASIEHLVSEDTLNELSPADIGVLVTAVALHDIGMHTNHEMFKNMIDGKYDNIPGNWFEDEPSWKELWHDYLKESHYWDAAKRENVTGDADYIINEESLSNKIDKKLKLDGSDTRFIGEFIRKHHPRLAYEIALKGYIGNTIYEFKEEGLPEYFMQLSGLVARSHGINVRDAIKILKQNLSDDEWKTPSDIKVVFLMTLIRIADYLQIHPTRSNKVEMSLRTVDSPISKLEHEMHKAITHIHLGNDDPERIVVQANPQNAPIYVKIKDTVQDIQKELDLSWAILGEVYGSKYKLRFRRIVTTITDKKKIKSFKFVPKQFEFKFNNELPKLLIAPLYGNEPTYGVRELVQNAVDACRTRMALDEEYNYRTDFTHVKVTIDPETAIFRIEDTGIGMNIEEIEKYFLTIGSSYGHSTDWKKTQGDSSSEINKIYRTGRFGIGILAAFLIGPSIAVKTKRFNGEQGYEFTLSLNQGFIQINKIDMPKNYSGTTIEIKCTEEAFDSLNKDAQKRLDQKEPNRNHYYDILWFDWYVDSKPKVEYFYGDEPIKAMTDLFTNFKPLSCESSDYKDIYWKPYNLVRIGYKHSELYCNGFLITLDSDKDSFSFTNLEKYLPYFFRIPSLKLTDINNKLPLNLQRNDIDENATYGFELDLLKAMCKDYLCQLLSLDISHVMRFSEDLFLFKSGFTLNNQPGFPLRRRLLDAQEHYYPQKCLQGKTLVHIFYNSKEPYDYQTWKPLIESHEDVFFTFFNLPRFSSNWLYDRIHNLKEDVSIFNQYFIAIDLDKLKYFRTIDFGNLIGGESPITCGHFTIVTNEPDLDFAQDFLTYISDLSDKKRPSFFFIHRIEGEDIPSSLDSFINEYAGGDMIIPYEEEERKRKFPRIYQECGEDIERYRMIFKRQPL